MNFYFQYLTKKVKSLNSFNGDENVQFIYKENGNRISLKVKAKEDIKIMTCFFCINYKYDKENLLFANGYNSWTFTKEYTLKDKRKDYPNIWLPSFLVKKFGLKYYGDYFFKNNLKNNIHGFDVGYIKGKEPLFISSLNSKFAYLIINYYVNENIVVFESDVKELSLKKGDEFVLFDFLLIKDKPIEECFKIYFKFVPKIGKRNKLVGYCSWYNHFQNINEKIIEEAIDYALPSYEIIQIDDGYETFVGDWKNIDKNKFPNGLKPLAKKIKNKKLIPGIWVAPFICEKKSEIFKNHKDWIAKDKKEKPFYIGSNWSGYYALDFYNPEVREYIASCFKYLKELGFTFFKLDFLYASSIPSYEGKTRAMVARESYEFLRDLLKENIINGCGAVIPSSIGLFDYMRIGGDVSITFDDKPYMRLTIKERISTKQTVQNSIFRYIFNEKYFYNDPDCIILRKENTKLNESQKESLALINALTGSLFFNSDDLSKYDDNIKKNFNKYVEIFKNAKDKKFVRNKDSIEINFTLNKEKFNYLYDFKNGLLKRI